MTLYFYFYYGNRRITVLHVTILINPARMGPSFVMDKNTALVFPFLVKSIAPYRFRYLEFVVVLGRKGNRQKLIADDEISNF